MSSSYITVSLTGDHRLLAESLSRIHASCILIDHTVATFLPPLSHTKMLNWWLDRFDEADKGKVWIVGCFAVKDGSVSTGNPSSTPADIMDPNKYQLAGYAYLINCSSETGPFRGEVCKMLVDPGYRRQGVARKVLEKIEEVAAKNHLTRLVLDTTEGSPAEMVYPRLGWIRLGVLPAEGIAPDDGHLINSVFFYKLLEGHPKSGEIYQKPKGRK